MVGKSQSPTKNSTESPKAASRKKPRTSGTDSPSSKRRKTAATSQETRTSSQSTKTVAAKAPLIGVEATRTLIIDNGGDTVKFGWSSDDKPQTISNVTARPSQQWTVL